MKAPALYFATALCAIMLFACGTPSPWPLSFPSSKSADDRIIGKWKMTEDTNRNNFYEITKRDMESDFQYHVRFFDRGGTNPTFESNIFFSEINGVKFLNIPYYEQSPSGEGDFGGWNDRGYFFVRILETDKDFEAITTATVNTPAFEKIRSTMQLRIYMDTAMNNAHIYSDTAHFYKVRIPNR